MLSFPNRSILSLSKDVSCCVIYAEVDKNRYHALGIKNVQVGGRELRAERAWLGEKPALVADPAIGAGRHITKPK